MEEHLDKLIYKLATSKNEHKDLFSGVWWSNHESNPLLISFLELNEFSRAQNQEIQNSRNNFMSIQQFASYIYKRKLAEDKAIQIAAQKHEELQKHLDAFEQAVMECIKKFKEAILKDVLPDQPFMHLCNAFLKDYGDGNFKSDEELVKNTKVLIKDIIDTGAVEENKFDERISKDTDITQKVNQIERVLKNVKKCFDEGLSFVFKLPAEVKEIAVQYEKPFEIFCNSLVLRDNEHEMVSGWVREQVGASKTFEPLLNSKDHGFGQQVFHSRCDGKGPTIVFVETTSGKRFGGYANSSWHNRNAYIIDEKCFIFSLDLKEKYLHKPGDQYSMYGYSNHGPRFGMGSDFYLYDNCNSNNNSICGPNYTYNCGSRTSNDIAGSQHFTVKNYEVYQVKQ